MTNGTAHTRTSIMSNPISPNKYDMAKRMTHIAEMMATKLMICFIIMFHLLHESRMHIPVSIAAAWIKWML